MLFDINRFHFFVLCTWQFAIFFASQMIYAIFSNYTPKWMCENSSDNRTWKDGIWTDSCDVLLNCTLYGGTLTNETSQFFSMTQDLWPPCTDESKFATAFATAIFIGVLVGTVSCGTLSDFIGRKPVAIGSMSLGIACNILLGFVPANSYLLIGIRFVCGIGIGGMLVVVCTFSMEMLLPQQRMSLRAFFNWGTARLYMTLICMWFQDWRMGMIVCGLVSIPAIFILIFIYPESPTWLHNKGKIEEMRKSEKHVAKIAGIPYVPVQHKKVEHSKSLWELLHTKGLFKRLLVLWCMWFVASICGYGTDLYSNTISGNLYINQILYSIVIALSKMLLVFVDTVAPNFNRRTLHQGAQLCACICFTALTFMQIYHYSGVGFLVINLIGTVFIEYTWDACYLCAIESMETSCRASATGSCSLIARLGAMMAPSLGEIAKIWPPFVYTIVIIFGTINLFVSYFFLVETKNVNLDNVHVDDEEKNEDTPMLEAEN